MVPRLNSKTWVQAVLRRSMGLGVMATVLHHGDDSAGSVLVLAMDSERRAKIFSATTLPGGARAWLAISGENLVSEADAMTQINRHLDRDPDLWVLEIETQNVQSILPEPMVPLRRDNPQLRGD
ncbi:MAG: DUF1491 family protein [Sphingomonadales bacterium]|nr:MAG: DUF1491 family protein [Sphingomonadales bacterium]